MVTTGIRILAWIVIGMITLVVLAYGVLLVVNMSDQPPSPSARKMTQWIELRSDVSDQDNAFLYLLGFSIEQNQDPAEWGKVRAEWARQIGFDVPQNDHLEFPGKNFNFRQQTSAPFNKILAECRTISASCRTLLANNQATLNDWVDANDWLFTRYQSLIQYRSWRESIPFDPLLPLPRYTDVLDAQMLLHLNAWMAAGQDDAASVKALLQQDLVFWRNVLASTDLLITRMIAVAAIQRNFDWGNVILKRLPSDLVAEAVPDSWAEALSTQELSSRHWIQGEWQWSVRLLNRTKAQDNYPLAIGGEDSITMDDFWFVLKPLFQVQDSANLYAERLLAIDEAFNVPIAQYPQAIANAKRRLAPGGAAKKLPRAYNIIGNLLLELDWDITGYQARVADLEGIRRMSLALARYRSARLPIVQVPEKLAADEYRNPYTDLPFEWDDQAQAAVFKGIAPSGRHVYVFPY